MPGGSGTSRDQNKCENCGAALPAPDDEGNRTCTFCGEVSAGPSAGPLLNVTFNSDSTTLSDFETEGETTGRGCSWLVTLIVLAVVAAIAVPIVLAFGGFGKIADSVKSSASAAKNARVQGDSAIALPSEPSAPIPFVAVVSHNESSKTVAQVQKLDGHSSTPAWSSANLSDGTNAAPLATDGTNILVADKTRVLGLNGTDGTQVWQSSLTDEIQSSCEQCFFVIGNRLIAKSTDGTVQAFDTSTGKAAWSRRLADVSGRVLPANGSLLVVDGTAGKYSITVLNPADGSELQQIAPVCSRARPLSSDALILTAPNDPAIYVGFGLLPACWQKWDLATGAQAWNVGLEDGYLDSGAYGFVDGGSLYFAGRQRELLGRIDTASGLFAPIPALPDFDSVPIAVHANTLILRGKSTRGTTRYELWGMDLTSGAKTWELSLNAAAPADPPDAETIFVSDDQRFTVHLDGDVLRIVTFDGASRKLLIDSLNPDTGVAGPTGTIENATNDTLPDFTVIEWRGSTLLVALGSSMLDIDAANNSIVYRYP